jgi:predicted MFS family arabinose efflux permease
MMHICTRELTQDSGLAPSFWLVVIGRVVSGFGGAGLHSLVSIIITGSCCQTSTKADIL